MAPKTLLLDGSSLDLSELGALGRGERPKLRIPKKALTEVRRARKLVDDAVREGAVVYGLTTGFGRLKNVPIAAADLAELQRNLILSHACGLGEPMPVEEVRIAQVLRLNGLLRGHSGVRVQTVQMLARLYEADFVPVVPRQGSVGASGDLAPLSHMAATYLGHGEVWLAGKRMSAKRALSLIHI